MLFSKMEKKDTDQLYLFINPLSKIYGNRDDLGTLIGHGIVEGLSNFSSKSNSKEERKFGEIKTIYGEFKRILNYSNNQKENEYSMLRELQLNVGKKMELINKGNQTKIKSLLFREIVFYLKRDKNYGDLLRRSGLDLVEKVQKNGEIGGTNKKKMNIDSGFVEYCFTRKKGDRR